VKRSMKSQKGKKMNKAGGYVYICDTNNADTGFRVVSDPGLRRQDAQLGGQMEYLKSAWAGHTK
jgi:hypothetical protein